MHTTPIVIYMNNTATTATAPYVIKMITAILGCASWVGTIGNTDAATWDYTGGSLGARCTPRGDVLVSTWQTGAKAPSHMLHSYSGQAAPAARREELELLTFLRATKSID